jgi:hypothetical protein
MEVEDVRDLLLIDSTARPPQLLGDPAGLTRALPHGDVALAA